MALTRSRTMQQIEDWQDRGLIDSTTARRLLDDIGAGSEGRSFASIAVWLGIVCIAFGAMTFVAANWAEMSRLLRMVVSMGSALAAYIVAGVLHRRDRQGSAEAFVVLGCGIFGAAVMLTGQMYHLPGPPTGGVLLWTLGTFAAALATGSQGALGLTVLLATLWTAMTMTEGTPTPFHIWYLPLWAGLAVHVWWIRARWIAHLCAMGLLVWLGVSIVIVITRATDFAAGHLAMMGGLAAVSLTIASARTIRVLRGFEGAAVWYLLVLVYGAVVFLYGWREIGYMTGPSIPVIAVALPLMGMALWPAFVLAERFDHILPAIWIGVSVLVIVSLARGFPYVLEAFALAVSVWTIRMGGRQGWRQVTVLGYVAFAVTLFVIYSVAAHGLLGTSLFYLGAGVLLLVGALVMTRLVPRKDGPA